MTAFLVGNGSDGEGLTLTGYFYIMWVHISTYFFIIKVRICT
jgi:hypothetical protein